MREPEHIDQDEMRVLLCEAYSKDTEKSLLGQLTRCLVDPALPCDANNRLRVHPLGLILGLLALLVVAVFAYFSASSS